MAKSNIGNKYKKYELLEHIYELPDTYIGSTEVDSVESFVYNSETKRFETKILTICPGLYKIFDEIIVNACDQSVRALKIPVTKIMVNINRETGRIKVWNNGDGIEIDQHPEHKVYVPELIFANLLTSSNYNKDEERTVGGKNGLGAKLSNIFSKEFIIETVDNERKKMYTQRFYDNMRNKEAPRIVKCTKKPYTSIEFLPDYARFKMEGLTEHMYKLFERRVYDMAACTNNKVEIYLNDTKIDYKSFEKYIDLYIGPKSETSRVFEQVNDRWEVCIAPSTEGFKQVSFVNSIATTRGGSHVNYITNYVVKKLVDLVKQKKKKTVKPNQIKEYMYVFVKSTIVNPSFDSQSKETLTTLVPKFGSRCDLDDKFIDKVYKSGLIDHAVKLSDFQEEKALSSKLDAKKKVRVVVQNLDDANKAGTKESDKCTLILTEGLSAKTMAISGLSEIGRDYWGIYSLRGKILNVKDAPIKKIAENEEIANLMKIIGLEIGKTYTSLVSLRYGKIMILTDQDVDGSHIAGLLMNLFASMWPSLSQIGFIIRMITPIVKVTKGSQVKSFYNLTDYENWKKTDTRGWSIKYYKGLGSSCSKEAKEYFRNMNLVKYNWTDQSEKAIDLAFNKKRADDRKKWLGGYNRNNILDYVDPEVSFEEFIHKELIHFSNSDLERSIPSIMDGFKESQRKIFYACIKKKLTSEIKVAQLAGYVSEHTAYHHGEVSLQQAIVNMAQRYVGSNNINLLVPSGQFGTRVHNGRDAAASRYIFTYLSDIVKFIFKEDDFAVLNYLDDEGLSIEPEYYVPILPMVLINSICGIGSGYSTTIPSYDPRDVVAILFKIIDAIKDSDNEFFMHSIIDQITDIEDPIPFFFGFRGQIQKVGQNYISKGVYEIVDDNTVRITELPVYIATDDYKNLLDKMLVDGQYLKDYSSHYDDINVGFTLTFQPGMLTDLLNTQVKGESKFETEFKMINSRGISTTNMHLYNHEGRIQKYSTVLEIIKEFAKVRVSYYFKRKANLIKQMEADLLVLSTKSRFINDVITERVKIMNQKTQLIKDRLVQLEYPVDLIDMLIRMPINQLTFERKQDLEQATENCGTQLDKLRNTRIQDLWVSELEAFVAEYGRYEAQRHEEMLETKPSATAKSSKKRARK